MPELPSRMRILPKPYGTRALRLRGMHRITQHADARDAHVNGIARDERSDAGWCAGGDHITRMKRHHAGKPTDEKSARVGHEGCVAGLAKRAIHVRFDEDVRGIEIGFDVWAHGAESVKALSASELDVRLLQVAGGDVVEAGVAEHVFQGVVGVAEMRAAAANHESELAFMLDALE